MSIEKRKLTRAERNIAWVEKYLNFPDGPKVGQPFRLADFQKKWFYQIYDNEVPVSEVIISIPRKNSKTTTVAAILLLHLAGPESIPNSQLYSCAQVRQQAAVTFNICLKMIKMNPLLADAIRPVVSQKELYCDARGTYYRAMSKDATGQLGTNPSFVIFDEIGSTKGPIDLQYESMSTGTGVQKSPLFLLISTQSARDGDFLSLKIDDYIKNPQPDRVLILHTCPIDHPDPFSEDALRLANPAYDVFLNKEKMLKWAEQAKRIPTEESGYRNYALNQRVDTDAPFITKNLWDANNGKLHDIAGKNVYIGVDLSRKNDLTGLVAMYRDEEEKYSMMPFAYLPSDNLKEKAEQDRTPWDVWSKDGFLKTTPGEHICYTFAAEDIKKIDEIANIIRIAVDPYNSTYLKKVLIDSGFSEAWIEEKFFPFRQGFISMSPGVDELESLFIHNKIRHADHPVLRECFQNAKVVEDAKGNRKFEKMAPNRKKDLADCAAMCAAMIHDYEANTVKTKPKPTYTVYSF